MIGLVPLAIYCDWPRSSREICVFVCVFVWAIVWDGSCWVQWEYMMFYIVEASRLLSLDMRACAAVGHYETISFILIPIFLAAI